MKTIQAYEFKDLPKEIQLRNWEREIRSIVEMYLDFLNQDLVNNEITEEQYYEELGCSKYYAETTAWFVPSCYYEKHRAVILREVKESLNSNLYDKRGNFIVA